MIDVSTRRAIRLSARTCLATALVALAIPVGAGDDPSQKETLRFAADMARRGSWREANFRWERAARLEPDNSRILSNLAVSLEALGEFGQARETYGRALALADADPRISDNRRRLERFLRLIEETEDDGDARDVGSSAAAASRGGKGKAFRVNVALPVPARLQLDEGQKLLVTSFLHDESALLDLNRELVRFLRSEFRKRSELEVLDVVPAPAIPEQTLQDLIMNREFWMHLGREYDADLIVSGVIVYGRSDVSGFRDVDAVSPVTGQKVRQSRFVEQEEFTYELDILFIDGATGELRLQDRLQRGALFRGSNNDPITAFYELSESISSDVLAIVHPRSREGVRYIFRN